MAVRPQSKQRIAKLSVALLSLFVSLRCNVYDTSLLGNDVSSAGASGRVGHAGASGTAGAASGPTSGGSAGDSELGSGGTSAGFGGFTDMAGSMETGGSEPSGGTGGDAPGVAGQGGAAGAGKGGTAGVGTAGAGGTAVTGGVGGTTQKASGCAKLSVPLDDAADKAHFVISLTSAADLSGATISMRVYVQAGTGGSIFNYVQDSGTFHFLGVPAAQRASLSALSGWSTLSWNLGTADPGGSGIVRTSIKNIGIELNAQPSASWTSPTVIYVDSITVTTPTLSFTLDATASVYPTPTTSSAPSQALWLNSGASDTTATSASLSWQPSCP